jgi:hypothetical protein
MIPSKGMAVDADTHHGIHPVGPVAGCLRDGTRSTSLPLSFNIPSIPPFYDLLLSLPEAPTTPPSMIAMFSTFRLSRKWHRIMANRKKCRNALVEAEHQLISTECLPEDVQGDIPEMDAIPQRLGRLPCLTVRRLDTKSCLSSGYRSGAA